MKKITDLNENKTPVVRIDKSLNKFENKVLFPKKVNKANKMLKEIGLPKHSVEKVTNN